MRVQPGSVHLVPPSAVRQPSPAWHFRLLPRMMRVQSGSVHTVPVPR